MRLRTLENSRQVYSVKIAVAVVIFHRKRIIIVIYIIIDRFVLSYGFRVAADRHRDERASRGFFKTGLTARARTKKKKKRVVDHFHRHVGRGFRRPRRQFFGRGGKIRRKSNPFSG